MAAATAAAAAAVVATTSHSDDDWEIINDRGFVYKRRRRDDADDPGPPPSSADPEAELRRNRRSRRRICLLNLRDKYRRELHQWETLSASLSQIPPLPPAATTPPPPDSPHRPPPEVLGEARRHLIDDLLSHVEAQEAVLNKVSELCDFVEGECRAREERVAEALFDLAVWRSPRSLVASLSDRNSRHLFD